MAEQYLWTPADGGPSIDLSDEAAGYSVEADGTRGLRSLPYRFTTAQYAGVDGDEVLAIRAEANRPQLAMLLQADSEAQLRTRARALVHAMRPKAGPGLLTVANETGERRRLRCYVEAGLEGDESEDTSMPDRWWKFLLKLYAPRPWWEGEQVNVDFGLAAPSNFFPFFPLVLSASTVQGQQTIDLSDTDAPTYPVWTVTGPGSSLVLRNTVTTIEFDDVTGEPVEKKSSRTIEITTVLGDGQTLVIDTRPGRQIVYRGDLAEGDAGWNLMDALSSDPALWPLVDGVNEVSALLTGAGPASRIRAVAPKLHAGS